MTTTIIIPTKQEQGIPCPATHSIQKQPNKRASLLFLLRFLLLLMMIMLLLLKGSTFCLIEPKRAVIVVVAAIAALLLLFIYYCTHGGINKNVGEAEFPLQQSTLSSPATASPTPSPPTLSPQCSRLSLVSSSEESTVSEDSILAAISMLFIEVEQQVEQEYQQAAAAQHPPQQPQEQQETSAACPITTTATTTTLDGCLTARILPRCHVDYEKRRKDNVICFPEQEQFAKMASILRESIEPKLRKITQGPLARAYKTVSIISEDDDDGGDDDDCSKNARDNDDDDDDDDNEAGMMMMVALDLRLTIPSRCNPKIHHCVHMQLHRHATEPAVRTLERVEISLSRKLRQEEHILAASINNNNNSNSNNNTDDCSLPSLLSSTISNNTSNNCIPSKNSGSAGGRQKSHRALEREHRRNDRKEERQREQQQQLQLQQNHHERFLAASSHTNKDPIIPSPPPPPPPPRTLLERHIDCETPPHHLHGQSTCYGGSVDSCSFISRDDWCSSSSTANSNCSNKALSTIWVKDENEESDHNNDDGFRLFSLEQQDSATLWKELASRHHHHDKRIHLQLRSATRRTGSNKGDVLHEQDNLPPIITLPIYSCPPTILEVDTYEQFTAFVYVGVPLVIETTVLHATRAMIIWFIVEDNDEDNDDGDTTDGMQNIKYTPICFDSPIYTPREQDIGKRVGVLIIPMRPGHLGKGYEESFCFQQKVQARPDLPLVHPLRTEWTEPRMVIHKQDSNDSNVKPLPIRVMTYNLLADLYTSREIDQQTMYTHCPVQYLDRKRRMPLLLYEILSLQPDIICLQEVDSAVYEHLLRPCLETCAANYQGFYSNKASVQLEGCAMFWSLGRFHYNNKPGQYNSFALRDLFTEKQQQQQDDNDGDDDWSLSMQGIYRLLDENLELATVAKEKVGQVLQVAELRLLADEEKHQHHNQRSIVVGNTHLFYHPLADHVRVIQAYMACRQLDTARRHACAAGSGGGGGCPMILCGDFNSYPLSGTMQLLLQGSVGPEHRETWKHLKDYHWAMGEHDFLLEHGFIGNDVDETPTYEDEEFEDALEEEVISQVEDYISGDDDDDDDVDYYCNDPLALGFPLNEDYVKLRDVLAEITTRRKINRRRSSSGRAPTIALPDSFPRLISGYKDMPEFTNYAIDFAETLDYILVSSNTNDISSDEQPTLVPRKSAPLPTTCWMKENGGAMPNECMPSDHVSLVCDLDWVANATKKTR